VEASSFFLSFFHSRSKLQEYAAAVRIMPKIGVVSAAGERERERESVSNLNLA
jgi:hypothetical protein